MVKYSSPEPEFINPLNINGKEEQPILLAQPKKQEGMSEPVIMSNIGQKERDELAARVRAINAGRVFDAPPVIPPFPKTGIKQPKVFTPPTFTKPPKLDEVPPWYKQNRRQSDKDSSKPVGRLINIRAIVSGLPKEQADKIVKKLMAIHQEHVESGVPAGFDYTSSGKSMQEVDRMIRNAEWEYDFDWLDRKARKQYATKRNIVESEPIKKPPKGWWLLGKK